jgi:hypothetical protein
MFPLFCCTLGFSALSLFTRLLLSKEPLQLVRGGDILRSFHWLDLNPRLLHRALQVDILLRSHRMTVPNLHAQTRLQFLLLQLMAHLLLDSLTLQRRLRLDQNIRLSKQDAVDLAGALAALTPLFWLGCGGARDDAGRLEARVFPCVNLVAEFDQL